MKVLLHLLFTLHLSSAGLHSLQYLYTATSPGITFPEFTAVGLMDEKQCVYYDSNIMQTIPRTKWIENVSADDPHYWDKETENKLNDYYTLTDNMDIITKSFNHTAGVHTLQRMYGCEDDDDFRTSRGFDQYGYDGEDFISLDMKTATWTATKPQALNFVKMWDPEGAKAKSVKNFLENECIEWLKKFVSYGGETLEVDPKTSLFQKHSSSSEVVCHATGFFPRAVLVSWKKDGDELLEDVELRETLPNEDGTFQKRSILKVSAEELQKHTYTCVIEHSSLEKEMVLEVPKGGGSGERQIIAVSFMGLLFLLLVGILCCMKNTSGFQPIHICRR